MRSHQMLRCGAFVAFVGAAGCRSKGQSHAAPTPSTSATVDQATVEAAQKDAERRARVKQAFANVPNEKEWLRAADANVTGASALACDAKIVNEWMRLYCHGKNSKGGLPTSVAVTGASAGVTKIASYTAREEGVALQFPYASGAHLEAVFSWTDGNRKLTVDWPSSATTSPGLKGTFAAFTGDIKPVSVDIEGTFEQAPVVPVRAKVEDMIANGKSYNGKVVSVIGWQNGSVDTYIGMGEGLSVDEDSLNEIFFKTKDLTPEERKMLLRGACHVVVVGVWDGSIIDTYLVRKTSGAENAARTQQMIDDETTRLRQKGF